MKEINYWQQFLKSGSVEDYLSYKDTFRQSEHVTNSVNAGAEGYAGVHRDNGNVIKDGAYR